MILQTVFTPDMAKDLMSNISKGVYTLRDMYEQFKSIQKLGPMSQVRCVAPCTVLVGHQLTGKYCGCCCCFCCRADQRC